MDTSPATTDRSLREYLCRRPDWRYRLALEYASYRRTTRPLQCPLVDMCVSFLKLSALLQHQPRRYFIPGDPQLVDFGPFYFSHKLFFDADYAELKLELEVRILARQSDVQIAMATGLPAEVCASYEQMFYNVRHRLDGDIYVLSEVIGYSQIGHVDPLTHAKQALYMLAYVDGSRALEVILVVRRLLAGNTAEHYRDLVRSQLLGNTKLRNLLTSERLQPLGIAAHTLLTDLLGCPLDLPREPTASDAVMTDPAPFSLDAVLHADARRAAG